MMQRDPGGIPNKAFYRDVLSTFASVISIFRCVYSPAVPENFPPIARRKFQHNNRASKYQRGRTNESVVTRAKNDHRRSIGANRREVAVGYRTADYSSFLRDLFFSPR